MKSDQKLNYYPLSSPQREIWFDQRLNPELPQYNIGDYVQIDGPINAGLFETAVNLLVQRHDTLRTQLAPDTDEVPMQIFLKDLPVTVPFHDFSDEKHPRESALAWMQKEFVQPFDLYGKSLFHFALLKIDENCYFWFKKYHHIIIDGGGTTLLIQSLSKIYTQLAQDKKIDCSAPSYVEFVRNDKAYVESDRFKKHRQYWLGKYQTLPEALCSPRYLYRFDGKTPPSGCQTLPLERPIYNRLIDLAQNCNVSTFHVILGALYVYFIRTGQNEDFVVGLPVLNRSDATFKNTAGLFEGVSAARFNFGTELNFKELLESICKELKQNYRNQRFPLSELNREVGLQKTGRKQLFDISISYEKHSYDASFDSSPIQVKTLLHGYEQTPLMIYLREFHDDEDVYIDFVYNLAYFNAKEIEQIQARIILILKHVLKHVDESIRTIPLLTEFEQQQLQEWNQTETDYPKDKTIVDLFQEQVVKTANNIAVVFPSTGSGQSKDQQLTYNELNQKANQVAHHLLSIKRETDNYRIGICMERSMEMVIGLLGILKVGAAYIPLDPDYPQQRLQFMLEDSQVPVLLTQERIINRLPKHQAKVVCLDGDWKNIEEYSTENPIKYSDPANPAYVIYTSGSTGEPKGVIGTHQGMVNRLNWMWQTYPFKSDEVCCHRSSINFVDHIAELFSPLLQGVPLILISNEKMRDTFSLMEILNQYKVTRLLLVPSLLRTILEQTDNESHNLSFIKYWVCSGETLPCQLVTLFYEKYPECYLLNIYGSSEVSADVIAYQLERQDVITLLNYFLPEHKTIDTSLSDDLSQETVTTNGMEIDKLKQAFTSHHIPVFPQKEEEYYDYLKEYVLPYIVNTASPKFIGHMTSALPSFNYKLTDIISRTNQNMVKVETSKSLVFMERQAMAMLHHAFFDFPEPFYKKHTQQTGSSLGITVSGGSTANISALWVARNLALPPDEKFSGISEAGLNKALTHYNYDNIVLLGTRLMHYSMKKAASLLGMGRENIIFVDQDENGKMDIDSLQLIIEECQRKKWCILAIVGIAGTTETGIIDPLDKIANIAKMSNIYFHVDAAWGGPVIFSNRHKSKLKGIEKVDSITLCGHKQLYLPMGISFCLFRQPDMARAISTSSPYQAREGSYDFGQFSPEGSRSSLSMCLHAAFHLIGKQGYAKLIDDGIDKAQYLKKQILKNNALELIMEPELNIVNFRYIPKKYRTALADKALTKEDNVKINEINIRLQETQFLEGRTFLSRTQLSNTHYGKECPIDVNRAVLANPLTTNQDVDCVIEDLLTIASDLIENAHNSVHSRIGKKSSNVQSETSKPSFSERLKTLSEKKELLNNYTIPIGKPIANTKVYILDIYQKPVPVGMVGELYIGGVGIAHGYLNSPELTAEKFIELNLFGQRQRLYKTGDLARHLSDGNIEFLGRQDNQIKLRGFRIEPGEIESALNKHEIVRESVLVLHGEDDNQQLVAYIILNTIEDDVENVLRSWLKNRLPEYMIPSSFVVLDKLPLMPNGKIDRKSLEQLPITDVHVCKSVTKLSTSFMASHTKK